MRFAIEDAFRKEGIKIPFPQREIHVAQGSASPPPGPPQSI